MRLDLFKLSLCESAREYAEAWGMTVNDQYATAVIFDTVADNLCPASYSVIQGNPGWLKRTLKPHNNVKHVMEMQSSNSSDALLMSIFCHPKIATWKGVSDVLGFSPDNPEFGFKPRVNKQGTEGDETEIDMSIGDCFVEAKLTEKDFTDKPADEVLKYTDLSEQFHVDLLPVKNDKFQNYQIIRNLLAAIQHGRKHILMCDERRPDLAMKYMHTVSCLRDPLHRMNCRVLFWQDLQRVSGRDLTEYLVSKYRIC